jgi:AcrR family transcriptional regulator
MRYSAEHKQRTREAILTAGGRVFRAEGYGGSGIDELTKAAGVTNGAFYGHFKTKAEAFREIVTVGLEGLVETIDKFQADHGNDWLAPFVKHYLGQKLTCALGDACTLPMLSTEVARADAAAHAAFDVEFRRLVQVMAKGLDGDEDRAVALLAMLSGAATFARAVSDPALAAGIAKTVQAAALAMAGKA